MGMACAESLPPKRRWRTCALRLREVPVGLLAGLSSETAIAETVFRLQVRECGAERVLRRLVGAEQYIQFSDSVRVCVSHVGLTVPVFQKLRCGLLQQRAHVLKHSLPLGQLGSQHVADIPWILLFERLAVNCLTHLTQLRADRHSG